MWSRKARAVLGLAILALLAAVYTANWFLLFASLAFGLQLAYAAWIFDPADDLEGTRTLELGRIQEGDRTPVETRVENTGTNTQFLEVRERLPRQLAVTEGRAFTISALEPGDGAELSFTVEAPLMGVYDVGPLEARHEDPFSLFYAERPAEPFDELPVVPREAMLDDVWIEVQEFQNFQGEYAVNQPGDGFDFYGLREYVSGDSYSDVNWKASARADELMVNQFERATSTEVAFLVDGRAAAGAGPEDRTPYVRGARALRYLLEAAFDERNTPRIDLYGDGFHTVHPGPPERMRRLTYEALLTWEPSGDEPLFHAIGQVLPHLSAGSVVVVVSSLLDDPTASQAIATALAHDFTVVLVAPPVDSVPGVDEAQEQALLAAREQTLKAVRGFGIEVVHPNEMQTLEVAP